MVDIDRVAKAGVDGIRMVFAGAAGGIAYQVVEGPGGIGFELTLFGILILMVAVIEYTLLAIDPDYEPE